MKRITFYISVVLICLASSCTKNFTSLNNNPVQFTNPDAESIFTGAVKNTIAEQQTNNLTYLWEYSHFIEKAGRYLTGDDGNWTTNYITVLGNLTQLKNLYQGNPSYTNRVTIADIWQCYVYSLLVGTYGPVPYSQVGTINNPVINYDDENTIYTSLLARLKTDASAISLTGDKLNPDVLYAGNLTSWIKFANSLRLRIALRCQRNLPALAVPAIQELMANESMLLASDADDAQLAYSTTTGSQSPYYTAIVTANISAANTPVMSDYVFTYFRSYNDPRLDAYFLKATTGYSIRDTLTSTTDAKHYIVTYPIPHLGAPKSTAVTQLNITSQPFSGAVTPTNFSTLQPALFAANRPFYIMTYADVCFMKAEASYLGYGGSQTADQYYYAGINANFTFWGLSAAAATTYEAQNGIKWSTAGHGFNYDLGFINTSIPASNLTKIWIQQWLNYYDDGAFDAWCLQRRTQNLVLPPHTNPATLGGNLSIGDLPDRWYIPVASEQSINTVGYQSGVKELGGPDLPSTLLQFAVPYTHTNWATAHGFIDYSFVEKWYGTTIQSLTAAGIKYTLISTY